MNKISLILAVILINPILAYADSSRDIILVEDDSFVDKSGFFERSTVLMTGFGGTRTKFIFDEGSQKPYVISNNVLPTTAYLKFDLKSVPKSSLFETVNIDDAKLKLFFTDPDESDATMYVFTVSYCANNQWTQDNLMWDNRPCKNNLEAIDTTVIIEEDIPGFVELNIVEAINKVKNNEQSKITLALDARPTQFDVEVDKSNIGKVTNFVQDNWEKIQISDFRTNDREVNETFQGNVDRQYTGIWKDYLANELLNMKNIQVSFVEGNLVSMNYSVTNSHLLKIASLESEQLGHAISPVIIIDYTVGPSVFNDAVIFTLTTILPTLTIVMPVFVWLYNKSK